MRTTWSHQADWAALPENVSQARRFVSGHLAGHGLGALSDDVRLVVSELVTNAVLHARTPFTVMVSREDGTVELAVTDGMAYRPDPMRGTRHWSDTRGRGLYMVDIYSDTWGVTPTTAGKTVWASFVV
jgi:anti-sigma regulatory factor (Ser/Thr protein kinase)